MCYKTPINKSYVEQLRFGKHESGTFEDVRNTRIEYLGTEELSANDRNRKELMSIDVPQTKGNFISIETKRI